MQAFVKYPHFSDTFFTLSLNLALLLSMFCLTHAKVIFVFLQWDKITMTVLWLLWLSWYVLYVLNQTVSLILKSNAFNLF